MVPEAVADFFTTHQDALWILTVILDLGMTLLLFRLFGKMGLYAVVVLDILRQNGISLTTDVKSLHPAESGWNRRLN